MLTLGYIYFCNFIDLRVTEERHCPLWHNSTGVFLDWLSLALKWGASIPHTSTLKNEYYDFKDSRAEEIGSSLKRLLTAIHSLPLSTAECERALSRMPMNLIMYTSSFNSDSLPHVFIAVCFDCGLTVKPVEPCHVGEFLAGEWMTCGYRFG